MVDNPLYPDTQEPLAKKTRMEQFSQAGSSAAPTTNETISEEAVRRYLKGRPMTTKDLLKRFMFKKTGILNNQLVQPLARILKKIKPHKHEVKGVTYLSLKDEKKPAKNGPDLDEPLRNGLAKEAGAMLEEMVLMEDDSYPLREKSAGGKGCPVPCGWWGGGKPASAACFYSSYELEGAGSKNKTHSCKPLMGKARVTPLPKIEEGLRQSTLRSKEVKAAPAEPKEMETE